jgi:hypothetical protein
MKIEVILSGNHLQHMLFVSIFEHFRFLSHPRATDLFNHSVTFSLIGSCGMDKWFFVPFDLMFIFTLYIEHTILHRCHWNSLRSELLRSSWMMDIPRWLLNLTDRIAYEFEKAEIQAVKQHPAVREASEQIKWLWSSQNVRLNSRPS